MANIDHLVLTRSATLRVAMDSINRGALQIALITDDEGKLLATVTDGDIRRGILRGVALDASVSEVMNTGFTCVKISDGRKLADQLMRTRGLHQIPVVDEQGYLVDLFWADQTPGGLRRETQVVLMAGGLGTRLRPLTETVPKPMLQVAGKPILELILQSFVEQGFRDFTISLNYKGEMIRDHFGDGHQFGANVDYIQEHKRMGTAGALSLLSARPSRPFIVMNGDLLTAIPFDALIRFHAEIGAMCTMCARDFPLQVPYGVIKVENSFLKRIVEKPTYSHLVNAGIYVLSPEALDHVRADEFLDMPTLFQRVMGSGEQASVFPIQEFWMDIGRPEDLLQADDDYDQVFGTSRNDGLADD